MSASFDTSLRDAQSTYVKPLSSDQFDLSAYAEYESALLERNRNFASASEGLLVYRRFRADGVFYDKCADRKQSLELQLSALAASMDYPADIANFLEPWYGIGYISACFGSEYTWHPGQAPAVNPQFDSFAEMLKHEPLPIEKTSVGRHMLEMIEYFLDKTKGRVPISYTDIQSPFNMLSYLLPITNLFLEIYDDPEQVRAAAGVCTNLLIDFVRKQKDLIGDCLALPGHGFASSRAFAGIGFSDDNAIMISADDYGELFKPYDELLGAEFGGAVFHSCGNWENKIELVQAIAGLRTVDAAFGAQTDPSPNDPEIFGREFACSQIVLNARCVGDLRQVQEQFGRIWRPGLKLIAVTYGRDVQEQTQIYNMLHEMAGE
jgi:hypothetical protein